MYRARCVECPRGGPSRRTEGGPGHPEEAKSAETAAKTAPAVGAYAERRRAKVCAASRSSTESTRETPSMVQDERPRALLGRAPSAVARVRFLGRLEGASGARWQRERAQGTYWASHS